MNDILASAAFLEFLQKRCEEIITNDEECKNLTAEALQLEKKLYPLLGEEELRLTLEIDNLNFMLFNCVLGIFYRRFYDNSDNLPINNVFR
jgi:hypothetical protein